jgi:DNA-binding MarR family transcriptional regulator
MIATAIDNIRHIYQVLGEHSRKIEHETGLSGSKLWVIKMLDGAPPMKVSELARRMHLHPATMVGVLDRLEAKGLVQRTRSNDDRRVVHIVITEQGRELIRNSPEMAQGLLVKGLETLTDKKVKIVSEGLEQIVSILEVLEEPPKRIHSSDVITHEKRRKSGK